MAEGLSETGLSSEQHGRPNGGQFPSDQLVTAGMNDQPAQPLNTSPQNSSTAHESQAMNDLDSHIYFVGSHCASHTGSPGSKGVSADKSNQTLPTLHCDNLMDTQISQTGFQLSEEQYKSLMQRIDSLENAREMSQTAAAERDEIFKRRAAETRSITDRLAGTLQRQAYELCEYTELSSKHSSQLNDICSTVTKQALTLEDHNSRLLQHSSRNLESEFKDQTNNASLAGIKKTLAGCEHNIDRLNARVFELETLKSELTPQNSKTVHQIESSIQHLGNQLSSFETSINRLREDIEAETTFRNKAIGKVEDMNMELSTKIQKNIALVKPIKEENAAIMIELNELRQRERPDYEGQIAEVKHIANLAKYDIGQLMKSEKKSNDIHERMTTLEKTIDDVATLGKVNKKSIKSLEHRIRLNENTQSHENGLSIRQDEMFDINNTRILELPTASDGSGNQGCSLPLARVDLNNRDSSSLVHRLEQLEQCHTRLEGFLSLGQQVTDLETVVFEGGEIPDRPSRLLQRVLVAKAKSDITEHATTSDLDSEDLRAIEVRLASLEKLKLSKNFPDLVRTMRKIDENMKTALKAARERSSELKDRLISIEDSLNVLHANGENRSDTTAARGTPMEPVAGVHDSDFSNQDQSTDHSDFDLGQLCTVSTSDFASITSLHNGHDNLCAGLNHVQAGLDRVEAWYQGMRKDLVTDFKCIHQKVMVISNRLESEITKRQVADARIKLLAVRNSFETTMQFEQLWEFMGNSQFGTLTKIDAREKVTKDRKALRWWSSHLESAKTLESLGPWANAVADLCKGKPVSNEYEPHSRFPDAKRRLHHLVQTIQAGLPTAEVFRETNAHRALLEQSYQESATSNSTQKISKKRKINSQAQDVESGPSKTPKKAKVV